MEERETTKNVVVHECSCLEDLVDTILLLEDRLPIHSNVKTYTIESFMDTLEFKFQLLITAEVYKDDRRS